MSERKSIGKAMRFEVFKRDKFTCQYCGAKAPDVVLHIDHIHPVADGGENEIMNLVAACQACNGGKGARLLDDSSAIERQRTQIEALATRREQLEMMMQWRDGLESVTTDTVELIVKQIEERGGFGPNENGKANIRRWLKKYTFDEILRAVDGSFDSYMRWSGDDPDERAWEIAFKKVPAVCSIQRQSEEKPYLPKLFYIQGILRRRFSDHQGRYLPALEEMILEWGAKPDDMENTAKISDTWDQFNALVSSACFVAAHRQEEDANGQD